MRAYVGILGVVLLGGCASTQPVVSDIRHDMAKIQMPRVLLPTQRQQQERKRNLQAEADRACAIYGRIASQQISSRCVKREPNFNLCVTDEILFACAPADGED